jgi:hypothetical protein
MSCFAHFRLNFSLLNFEVLRMIETNTLVKFVSLDNGRKKL